METAAKIAEHLAVCARVGSALVPEIGAVLIRAGGKSVTVDAIVQECELSPISVRKALNVMACYSFAEETEGGWRMAVEKILEGALG